MSGPAMMRAWDAVLMLALAAAMGGVWWFASWPLALLVMLAVIQLAIARRRATEQGQEMLAECRRLAVRGEESARLQGRFVGTIAHELKSPLAVMLGETEVLLLRCGEAVELRGIAESIIAELRHLAGLIDSFMHLAHPFAQAETSEHLPVYFSDVVIEAVGRCRGLSNKRAVRVLTILAAPDNGDPSAEVLGDALLLEVMVENLLRNALRFSEPGAQIEVRTIADRGSVRIVVRDHGVGIPVERRHAVFDWFFDAPRSVLADAGTGAGFGLAITKRIVEHHGGTIELREAAGGGCEFEIRLPRWWADGELPTGGVRSQSASPPVAPVAG